MMKKKYNVFFPLKQYGQNFLLNEEIIQKIITIINPHHKEVLLEIGPGLGALTEPICHFLSQLNIVEIDLNILNVLKKKWFYSKLIIFYENALNLNFWKIFKKKHQLIRIFGNLPYNISTSLIIILLKNIHIIQDMHFMLQKEVAERLIAVPGKKSYGRISIISQYYCKIEKLIDVNPMCFWPSPKVQSAFIKLTPHVHTLYFVHEVKILSFITNLAFQKRRKMIRQSLISLFSKQDLIKLEIDPIARAENLSVSQYCKLSNFLYKKNIGLIKN